MNAVTPTESRSTEPAPVHDAGFTVVEMVVVVAILSMLSVAIYATLFGLLDNANFAESLAQAERDARPVMAGAVIELRQAEPPAASAEGEPVSYLADGEIVFYSDRRDDDGPEQIHYHLKNCVDGLCELHRTIVQADSGTGPNWTYASGTVLSETLLVDNVVDPSTSAVPLFAGVEYVDGTRTLSTCDRSSGVECDFSLVQVYLQIDPNAQAENPRVYEVFEEVRMRNADV
jgi:prepilin-type N-terminal cleavage/methylation domain-containing protein